LQIRGQRRQFGHQLAGAALGEARHAVDQARVIGQLRIVLDDCFGPRLQGGFAPVQVSDMGLEVLLYGTRVRTRFAGRMQARTLAGELLVQLRHAMGQALQLQHLVTGRHPRPERHALHEEQQAIGVDGIGLGPHHVRFGEAPCGPRIDHHQFDGRVPVQGQRQLQMIDAGGFQADPGRVAAVQGPLDELAVAAWGIAELAAGTFRASGACGIKGVIGNVDSDQVHLSSPGRGSYSEPRFPQTFRACLHTL
jgi:hypothetical protein